MKLVSELFNSKILFEENIVNALVIENPKLFNLVISSFINQINGEEGKLVLSVDDKQVKMSDAIEIITNYIPFEINQKKLLSKISNLLEKEMINEKNYMRTMELLANIEAYVDELSEIFPCSLMYDSITAGALVKMTGLKICNDAISELETIYNYMNLVRELDKEKLFVFVNMRSYYGDEEMQNFVNTLLAHKFKVLLIDSHCRVNLQGEERIIIDEDLCEI